MSETQVTFKPGDIAKVEPKSILMGWRYGVVTEVHEDTVHLNILSRHFDGTLYVRVGPEAQNYPVLFMPKSELEIIGHDAGLVE